MKFSNPDGTEEDISIFKSFGNGMVKKGRRAGKLKIGDFS